MAVLWVLTFTIAERIEVEMVGVPSGMTAASGTQDVPGSPGAIEGRLVGSGAQPLLGAVSRLTVIGIGLALTVFIMAMLAHESKDPANTVYPAASLEASTDVRLLGSQANTSIPQAFFTAHGTTYNMGLEPSLSDWPLPAHTSILATLLFVERPIVPGSVLAITGNADKATVVAVNSARSDILIPVGTSSVQLPLQPGQYKLLVTATWQRGTAAFAIEVNIGQPH